MPIEAILRETRIRELKAPEPACVARGTTLREAISSMRARRAGCVLACEGDRLIGILTERDILRRVAGEEISFDSPVTDFMSSGPRTLTADDLLGDAIRLMDEGGYRHIPIVDKAGRVEAIISIQQIIQFLAELYPTEVLNLPPEPHQYMDSREGG
jgi:CBS domain-containing protein